MPISSHHNILKGGNMKRIFLVSIIIILIGFSFAQAQITKREVAKVQNVATSYDEERNFLGKDVHLYLNQELYLLGKPTESRKFGYLGFVKDYKKSTVANKSNVYKCCDQQFFSKYSELVGRHFKVIEIINHPKAAEQSFIYGDKYFLKLQAKDNGDIVYFEYDAKFESSFPFLVVSYFEKQKEKAIGKEFIIRGINWWDYDKPVYDVNTGAPIDFSIGSIWKCVDFTIEETYYHLVLILENEKREQISLSLDSLNHPTMHYVFEKEEADVYKQKFGNEIWQKILAGKIFLGMTDEMCELSWGKPKDINKTIIGDRIDEQWVYYTDQYIYFENHILTAIQSPK